MAKSRRILAAVVAACGFFAGTHLLAANPLTLVIHVDNYAQLSARDLQGAEQEASRIYKDAGIETVWVNPGETVDTFPEACHLAVWLLDREMSDRKIQDQHIAHNVLGQGARATGRAYIFTVRIAATADRFHRDFRSALGRVLAHEIGHMVLPAYTHSNTGIMRPELDLSAAPQRFSPEQVSSMHATVAADLTRNRRMVAAGESVDTHVRTKRGINSPGN
jgi:hypothetical protein